MVSPLQKQIVSLKNRKKSNKKNTKKIQKSKKIVKNKIRKKSDVAGKKRKQRRILDGQNYTIKKKSPEIINKKWIIYSLDGCPFCKDAKELLKNNKIDFEDEEFANLTPEKQKQVEADIDKQKLAKIQDVNEAQRYKDNPFRTFPRIFKSDGEFIGGYNDTRLYFEKLKGTYLKN